MVVERKIISSALLELRNEEPTTRDKWLTVDAWKKIIYTRYDFDSTIDFSASDSNRALNLLGAIRLKVSTGNNTGREYCSTDDVIFNNDERQLCATRWILLIFRDS
jgi:hypothetical protein